MQRLHKNSKAATYVWTTEISELSAKISIEEILKKWKEVVEDVVKTNQI
jgi:L-rhamnose mutarotase